jgi:hypothetical protein
MKIKPLMVLLLLVLVSSLFLNYNSPAKASSQASPDVYVGVDVAFESVTATEQLIDEVSSYTNVFEIGCVGYHNETRLTTLCQYVYDKGMYLIVFTDHSGYPSKAWLGNASAKFGDKFLGLYNYDEEGGKQLDQAKYPLVKASDLSVEAIAAKNYSDAAYKYVMDLNWWLRSGPFSITKHFDYPTQYQLFTSDYALYWYDYAAGYDTVFAEFGSNYSQQLNVALCRGAATSFGKDWGVIIAWKYRQPPYIESGPDLYKDMVYAYQNGAKYITIFDSDENYTQSILQQEHFDALKQFWQYTKDNPRDISQTSERTAYVLPEDYAFGFRGPQDRIWGLWGPDSVTTGICSNLSVLLGQYGNNLDIVYPNGTQTALGYRNVIYWNESIVEPTSTDGLGEGVFSHNYYYFAIPATALIVFTVAVVILKLKRGRVGNLQPDEDVLGR